MAVVRSLAGYGLTAVSAEEIATRMEAHQPQEWERTLQRVAAGEAKRVCLFVVWNDVRDFTTFLYSGNQEATIAHLFRALAEVASGEQAAENGTVGLNANADIEGWNQVACFDIGRALSAAVGGG